MADQLANEQIDELRDKFVAYDPDGKGRMLWSRFPEFLSEEFHGLVLPRDFDESDYVEKDEQLGVPVICFPEFLRLFVDYKRHFHSAEAEKNCVDFLEAMRAVDVEGTGKLPFPVFLATVLEICGGDTLHPADVADIKEWCCDEAGVSYKDAEDENVVAGVMVNYATSMPRLAGALL